MALDSSQYVNYIWKLFHELFYVLLIVSVSYFFSVVFVNRYVVITMVFLVNYLYIDIWKTLESYFFRLQQ